jgi:hypothetical protein
MLSVPLVGYLYPVLALPSVGSLFTIQELAICQLLDKEMTVWDAEFKVLHIATMLNRAPEGYECKFHEFGGTMNLFQSNYGHYVPITLFFSSAA